MRSESKERDHDQIPLVMTRSGYDLDRTNQSHENKIRKDRIRQDPKKPRRTRPCRSRLETITIKTSLLKLRSNGVHAKEN